MSLNLQRIGLIAARDYKAAITSRAFLFGLLLMPVLLVMFAVLVPRILNSRSPQIVGDVAVIDTTGKVVPELKAALLPEEIARRRSVESDQGPLKPGATAAAAGQPIARLTLVEAPANADVDTYKRWLVQPPAAPTRHLAVVVIQPDAVARRPGAAAFGSYALYTSPRLDELTEATLRNTMRAALIATRLRAQNLDPEAMASVQQVFQPDAVVVGAAGERSASRTVARFLPFACGLLLFVGVMTGGQLLMTSTVEEKSSRVIEVLLAAVSPLELMYGKLLGTLGLGLTMTAVYVSISVYALAQFSLSGLLDPMLIVYLVAFFVVTYLVFGSLMLTIGAAVNQNAEAQALLPPVFILLVGGYSLSGVIGQAPNSAFSVAMSFIPPVNTFAMIARLSSIAPPPSWEVWTTLLISLVTAMLVVWFAAKVFKVALLMHGRPPTFGTLLRWARMA
ncbi:MAG TPA: ABC transporter permease [Steroidobacteraceae bacterium]|nr:ABC transporter permease [Steroidobacteraceae bacterium]